MYAKVFLCLALPVVANAMGVIEVARKACVGPDGVSATETVIEFTATKEECIANCQSYSAAYPNDCRRTIVWGPDCGDDIDGPCGHVAPGSTVGNCWCNYQTTCGCECYICPIPDSYLDIDGPNGPYPQPDFDAISVCESHGFNEGPPTECL